MNIWMEGVMEGMWMNDGAVVQEVTWGEGVLGG